MAKETFMLVSLKEAKAKKLAQVISNETSRKILDYLAKGDKTESEIAKELGIAISTVHYNLKQLVAAKLVKADEFHYSKKGKEVNHYSLTNQFVVIAPSNEEGILDKLKKILPVAGIMVIGAGLFGLFSRSIGNTFGVASKVSQFSDEAVRTVAVPEVAKAVVEESVQEGARAVATSAPAGGGSAGAQVLTDTASEAVNATMPEIARNAQDGGVQTVAQSSDVNIMLWFLIGAFVALLLYVIVDYIRSRRKK